MSSTISTTQFPPGSRRPTLERSTASQPAPQPVADAGASAAGTSNRARPQAPEAGVAVEQLNGLMQNIRRELHFSVDEASGETIIKVIDVETQEVMRQIPPAEALDVIQNLKANAASLLGGFRA